MEILGTCLLLAPVILLFAATAVLTSVDDADEFRRKHDRDNI